MRKGLCCILVLMSCLCALWTQGQVVQLLPNPGFEQGLEGWSLWPEDTGSKAVVDEAIKHSGEASLRIDAVGPADRAFVNTSTTDFKTETIYRISVCIRKDAAVPDSAVGYVINYRGGEKGAILQRGYPMELSKTPSGAQAAPGDWVRWSGLFYCTPEITSWQFLLRVEYAVGSVWFDDIEFEELGSPKDITPDVWTYLPLGVEIGSKPAGRFRQHMEAEDEAYKLARRYNALLLSSVLAEDRLRQAERRYAYHDSAPPESARRLFDASEQALNDSYQAFARAFKSGEEADRAAFDQAADRLETAIKELEEDVATTRALGSVARAPQLPAHLGEQPRDLPPFDENGRMNRLLIGCWSPGSWREFEQPFELEFHSGWRSGQAETYTETEADFSNITELCDDLQEQGYAGTFAMMPFGQHDVIWAPEWFIEKHADDPDIWKNSWEGSRGRSRGSYYGLNYYHPAVREQIRDYLSKFASFVKDEPRVFFYETSQEAYPYFGCDKGRRETGYGPSALRAFHAWLAEQYESIAALNEAWGTQYANFEAVEPPPDKFAEKREVTPLVAEFERFREDGYVGYLKLIYDSIKAGDPTKPVAVRHSNLLTAINGARIFETCDILGYHSRVPRMQVMNCYLNTLARYNDGKPLAYLEDFWGCQQESNRISDERAQRRGLQKHVCRTFIWGRTLQMKWYAYTSGSYLTTYNGNWFNPRYDVLTMRYCAPALKVALDRMRNLDWVLTHSEIPQFRLCIWQPSASMRTQARGGLAANEIIALHQLIYPAGLFYELVPEEYFADGRAKLDDFDAVFLPCAEYLSEEHQQRLIDYVRAGGTLISIEPPGVGDELTRPSGLLLREVYGLQSVSFDEEAGRWEFELAGAKSVAGTELRGIGAGKGEAYLCPTALGRALGDQEGQEALIRLLAARVKRTAYAEDAKLEVILRVTEEGERYLFVLNPDPDERASDRLLLDLPVSAAVDVSVEGGYPVKVASEGERSSIAMTLGPCETAILYLTSE